MTSLEAMLTFAAREVKLYLAVSIPWSSRLAPSGPVPSSSSVHLRPAPGPLPHRLEVADRIHELLKHLRDQGSEFETRGPPNPYPFRASFPVPYSAPTGVRLRSQRGTAGIREERGVLAHERAQRRDHELACRRTR
jgi:hypothetical protein